MAGLRRALGAAIAVFVAVVLLVPPSPAAAAGPVIRSDFFGIQDDHYTNGSDGYGSARVWAAWCTVQPNPKVPAAKAAGRALGRAIALNAAAKRTRLSLSLGHPPAWVFNNHKKAFRRAHIWYCGARRSALAFPSPASLRSGPVRNAYAAYVAGVISAAKPYLKASPANKVVLQAWNEPNLGSGGRINTRIPGAAKTWSQAAESLREQERIMRIVAAKMIPRRYEISTPSMYGKPTKLGKAYFKAQARSRTVDSISLNFYTLYVKSPNSSIKKWRSNAARAKRVVTRHKALRSLPIWITETNHNLVNFRKGKNHKAVWTSPAAQKRLTEITTLEALRQGFAGLQWYQGNLRQTAVNVRAGAPATLATRQLRAQLIGRRLVGCSTRKSVTSCVFSATTSKPAIRATWSTKGRAGVTFSR